jgi:hypothetical protein
LIRIDFRMVLPLARPSQSDPDATKDATSDRGGIRRKLLKLLELEEISREGQTAGGPRFSQR